MEPSAKSPNVFLVTDPTAVDRFGYAFDGWHPDGTFHYTGEGQVGDQVMTHGNRATRDHAEEGRALRLFRAEGTTVHYIGEFELPEERPFVVDESRDREGALRKVFIFRLKPAGSVVVADADPRASVAEPGEIALESSEVESYVVQRPDEPAVAMRREALFVKRYADWLAEQSVTSTRHKVPTAGGRPMFTDLFDHARSELVEAKSSASRTHVRAALGQILDYGRYVEHESLAVLLPSEPEPDLIELLNEHGVGCLWETRQGFVRRDPVGDDGG